MGSQDPFDDLIEAVCVVFGYCGSIQNDHLVHVSDFIPDSGYVSADQFVNWVFLAEGVKPDEQKAHREALKTFFIERMGTDLVSVDELPMK